MRAREFLSFGVGLVIALLVGLGVFGTTAGSPEPVPMGPRRGTPKPAVRLSGLPLSFEANRGQAAAPVRFLARGPGFSLLLTPAEAILALRGSPGPRDVVRLQLEGANHKPRMEGLRARVTRSNYFLGNDPGRWRTQIPHFGRVRSSNVYPGVDVVYYGKQGRLEYDFVVRPGADPDAIRMRFAGAKRLSLDAQGNLVLHTRSGMLLQHAPVVYQNVAGRRRRVAGRYRLLGENRVALVFGAWDRTRTLVIDPVLSYSTYLGGNDDDRAYGIAVDGSGNMYIAGSTESSDFPTAGALDSVRGNSPDAFVSKISADGSTLLWSTYLGGSSGDEAHGIAVDASGNAYVVGFTSSYSATYPPNSFPTAPASGPLQPAKAGSTDAFVSKISADGATLVYSTYLGGSGVDRGWAIALGAGGDAYVTGDTSSSDFPVLNAYDAVFSGGGGYDDAFVARIDPAGTALVWATYLGGSRSEDAYGIAVDSAGCAYVTGDTSTAAGSLFPTVPPATHHGGSTDAYVAKLCGGVTEAATLEYSVLLGGSVTERGQAIAVDGFGNAWVTGLTQSTDFVTSMAPAETPYQSLHSQGATSPSSPLDAFVVKLGPAGQVLRATFLGGSGREWGLGIAVDATGSAYVAGFTESSDFPTAQAWQTTLGGSADAFLTKFTPDGTSLEYSSYLGGGGYDAAEGLALDAAGSAYLAGYTKSTDFPTAGSPYQGSLVGTGSTYDVFVAKVGTAACGGDPCTSPPGECFQSQGTCNAGSGQCDYLPKGSGASCTDDGNPCTVDECDGAGACSHFPGNGGATCRGAAGDCDLPETCTGTDAACPADAKSTVVCRAAAGECDVAESCDGISNDCPADQFVTAGVTCSDDGNVCTADVCNGQGACTHPAGNAGTVCRQAAGVCDLAATCTGGSADCPPNGFLAPSTVCRAAVGGCDVAEHCTGDSADCPADALLPSGTVCRGAVGECDLAETCTGTAADCPADAKSTAVCRTSVGQCDAAESCDGVSNDCPVDAYQPMDTPCGDGDACTANDVCDGLGACAGSSYACPDPGPCEASVACDGAGGCSTVPKDRGQACSGETAGTCDGDGACDGPPTLQLPADFSVEATGADGAPVAFAAGATDAEDGSLPVSCSPGSGALFAIGTTTVGCSALDSIGNLATGSFTVTVVDTSGPNLDLPGDLVVQQNDPLGAVVTFAATAFDLVDGDLPVNCAPASGSVFPLGTTTVACSATDSSQNTATGTFEVTVVAVLQEGRMTGGGKVGAGDGARVTYGFRLLCDAARKPQHLQVNWGGNRFHLEGIVTVGCADDPALDSGRPGAPFDTHRGSGFGRLNGEQGATVEWTLTDAGEPGGADTARIEIWDAGGTQVLSAQGSVSGNHQAHAE